MRTLLTQRLLLLSVTAFSVTALAQQPEEFGKRWHPDQEANARLAQASSAPPTGNPPKAESPGGKAGESKGGGGKSGDGGAGGGKPGEDKGGGSRDEAPRAQPAPRPTLLPGASPAEFAAPLQSDLLMAATDDEVSIGSEDGTTFNFRVNGEPVLLKDGKSRARLMRVDEDLVLEVNGEDGLIVTNTYHLEGGGKRLRVLTETRHPSLARAISSQRLYRSEEQALPNR